MDLLTPKQAYRVVRRHLTPDLLKPKYRKRVESGCDVRTGHCYAASEAFYHLVGGRDAGYKPMFVVHENEPHWWVQGPDRKVWDLTAEQFEKPVPYERGKGKGFLTRDPSKRAAEIIRRVTKGKTAMTSDLRKGLIRLAYAKPELREHLLPILKEARNPPFWNAAKADDAVGKAYVYLVDLKLGFDSWHEIPPNAQPLYSAIMKAMDACGKARQETGQVREMVRRKRY
jgi:hypothetical protein